MVDGWDSPTLVRLAGLDLDREPSAGEALALFHQVVRELDLPLPVEQEEVLRSYLAWVADRVVDGTMDPLQALETVHRDIVDPLGHPRDLTAWCFLWERNHPYLPREVDDAGAARLTKSLAEEFASPRGRRTRG